MNFRDFHTSLDNIHLNDRSGQNCLLVAVGIDHISTVHQQPNLGAALLILPDINPEALVRPHGDVDVLIGACDAHLWRNQGR